MRASDRALHQLVAGLARARPEDIEGVLDGLGTAHRATIERLLAEYRGEPAPRLLAANQADQAPALEGLSPWLVARLERRSQSVGSSGAFGEMVGDDARQAGLRYAMTAVAFETLRACATELQAVPSTGSNTSARDTARRRLFGGRSR